MKQRFSKKWKASKQPRKQRKYLANAPLHIKRKFLGCNLSKELREKYGRRNIPVVKGDTVGIMRGSNKKKKGKVLEVKTKLSKIYVEGMQVKKMDGSKANVPFRASNLQIIELNLEDGKRFGRKKSETEKGQEKTPTSSKQSEDSSTKEVKKEKSKDKKVEEKK